MGGDGGTKAVNRAYLRGAGAASTTGDRQSKTKDTVQNDRQIEEKEASRAMQYCYISDRPLQFNDDDGISSSKLPTSNIVTCRYGRLYNKEAAIEALLERKQASKLSKAAAALNSEEADYGMQSRLGLHVRGLKDLYNIRFQTIRKDDATKALVPVCPITGREMNGRIVAYALIPGHIDTMVNVVSEYALKQLSESDILTEYGATKKIRLLSPSSLYDAIDQEYMKEEETTSNSDKKKKLKHGKKRERDNSAEESLINKQSTTI
jgi:Rtf2 RING-finger